MALTPNQRKTGPEKVKSSNPTKRTGRADGTEPLHSLEVEYKDQPSTVKRAGRPAGEIGNSRAEITRTGATVADITSPQDLGRDATPLDEE